MQLSILLTGILASILFILSGISFLLKWGYFKIFALGFIVLAILMFILMILRNVKEEWKIGSYTRKEK